jgi:hypothetical protein
VGTGSQRILAPRSRRRSPHRAHEQRRGDAHVLTDDTFVIDLVNDDDAWQRLASTRDMMRRKTNRPPSKPMPVVADLRRARKALHLATRRPSASKPEHPQARYLLIDG